MVDDSSLEPAIQCALAHEVGDWLGTVIGTGECVRALLLTRVDDLPLTCDSCALARPTETEWKPDK